MIEYTIHDMITVLVDPDVGKPLKNAIDFQIGFFKTTGRPSNAKWRIVIKPYNEFDPESAGPWQIFHNMTGIQESWMHDAGDGIAIEKHPWGYKIYSSSPNFLINLFIQFILIDYDYSMVHAAAVADAKGHITLLPGAGGVGKTALLGCMVEEHGFQYMGDDIVILGKKGSALSFPRSFVLKEYHRAVYPEIFQKLNIKKRSNYRLKRFVVENAPFVGVLKDALKQRKLYHKVAHAVNLTPYLATVPVEEIFGPGTCTQAGNIEKIVFLERYGGKKFKLEDISEEALCRRMFAVIHHEWVASMQQLFTIGAMELIDLAVYFNKVHKIIKHAISDIPCKLLLIPENAGPKALMHSYLNLFHSVDSIVGPPHACASE